MLSVSVILATVADVLLLRSECLLGSLVYAANGPVVWYIFKLRPNLGTVTVMWQAAILIVALITSKTMLHEPLTPRRLLAAFCCLVAIVIVGKE